MIDVFMRSCPDSDLRLHLSRAVLARLLMMEGARVTVFLADAPEGHMASGVRPFGGHDAYEDFRATVHLFPREDFWRSSRTAAEEMALSDYVLIDDDQLPIGKTWLEDGMAALEAHPELAMLASWSVNGEVAECPGNADAWDATRLSIGTRKSGGGFVPSPNSPRNSRRSPSEPRTRANVVQRGACLSSNAYRPNYPGRCRTSDARLETPR